jgi:thiamine-monophosphate kinase
LDFWNFFAPNVHPFTSRPRESVAAFGEKKLITAIRRWLGAASPPAPHGIGDDCAVLPASRHRQLLTVDPVIFGRHFDARARPAEVGAKLLKRNLSDIAAMGGRPTAAVVSLALDRRVSRRWLEGFYRGLAVTGRRFQVPIVGGDVAEASGVLVASLTLLGEASAGRALTRTGARAGDWIYVTGQLGGSFASGHHQSFTPRLPEGAWLARQSAVRAMIDVSDGIAKDLRALTPPGTVAALDPAAVPRHAGASLRAAFTDGEDYELLCAVAARSNRTAFERTWRKAFPRTRLTCIGRFVPRGGVPAGAVTLEDYSGYEHLRG